MFIQHVLLITVLVYTHASCVGCTDVLAGIVAHTIASVILSITALLISKMHEPALRTQCCTV